MRCGWCDKLMPEIESMEVFYCSARCAKDSGAGDVAPSMTAPDYIFQDHEIQKYEIELIIAKDRK